MAEMHSQPYHISITNGWDAQPISPYKYYKWLGYSGISTVQPSEVCAPLTFSLLNVILNKRVAYLSCSCCTYMNNLEVVITLHGHKSIFHAEHLLLAV